METKDKMKNAKIGGFIIIAFLLIYIPSLFHWIFGGNISTELLRIGTIEDSVNTDAYLVRDETVLKSPFDGRLIPGVSEGEKVPAGFMIATLLNKSSLKLLDEVEQYNSKIIKAQNEKNKNQDFFSGDIKKIEDEIAGMVILLINEGNKNNLMNVKQTKEEINKLMQKKTTIIGGIGTSDAYINGLISERDSLQQNINSNTKGEVSQYPGVISYTIDGFEDLLHPASIKELTPEYLESIEIKNSINSMRNNDIIAQKPYAKIINNYECFIVTILDSKASKLFKAGEEPLMRINDISREIKGRIEYVSGEMSGKYVYAVRIDRCIGETASLRKINIDLIKDSLEGLKITLKSLMNIDLKEMTAQIILIKANCASIRQVKIDVTGGEYAIISSMQSEYKKGISLYDTYVINPKNIVEGQIINQ